MNQVKQTAVVKVVREKKLMMNTTHDEYKSDAPDSEDDSNDVVLAVITSDEEYADERPAKPRSGRAVIRRAQIDF